MQSMFSGRHFMHVRRTLALGLAVPLLLAGCTDEPTPKIPEPTTPSPASPSPSESEAPEQESAEDFIRRWVDASNAMQNSGDTAEYLRLSGSCPECKQVAQRVQDAFDSGGYFRTDGWTILGITDRTGAGDRPVLDVRVDSAPTVLKESKDEAKIRYPGGTLVYRFRLRAADPWSITKLTQVPS